MFSPVVSFYISLASIYGFVLLLLILCILTSFFSCKTSQIHICGIFQVLFFCKTSQSHLNGIFSVRFPRKTSETVSLIFFPSVRPQKHPGAVSLSYFPATRPQKHSGAVSLSYFPSARPQKHSAEVSDRKLEQKITREAPCEVLVKSARKILRIPFYYVWVMIARFSASYLPLGSGSTLPSFK